MASDTYHCTWSSRPVYKRQDPSRATTDPLTAQRTTHNQVCEFAVSTQYRIMAFDGDYDVMESARHEEIAEGLRDASLEQVAEHLAQVMSRLMYTQDLYEYALDQADLLSARACEMDARLKRAKRQNWRSFSKSLDGQLQILVGSRDMLHHCAEEYYEVIQDLQGEARVVENLMLARGVDQEGVVIMVDKYMDRDRLQRTNDVTTDDEMTTDDSDRTSVSELTLTSEVTGDADTEEGMITETSDYSSDCDVASSEEDLRLRHHDDSELQRAGCSSESTGRK